MEKNTPMSLENKFNAITQMSAQMQQKLMIKSTS